MAADIRQDQVGARRTPAGDPLRRFSQRFAPRENWARSRGFARRRHRDLRFKILPYDRLQVANAIVVFASALILFVVLLDPHFITWQATLPQRFVHFFKVVTDLGKSGWILVSTGLFFLLMAALDATMLRPRLRVRRAVRALAAGYVFAAVAISGIVANLSKYIIGRARPKYFDTNGSLSFDVWSGDAGWASFPSGHATTAMALGVALALLFPRFRWIMLCLGFWIAVSRLITRYHYPSDVLAGAALGSISAWLLARALARYRVVFGFDAGGGLVRRGGASGRLR